MADGIELLGFDELLSKLQKMVDNTNKYENKAIRDGADIVLKAQKDIVSREAHDTGKLEETLKTGRISTKQGVKSIGIGIQKDDNSEVFYGKFINWGFIRTTKGPKGVKKVIGPVLGIYFMERSIEENRKAIVEAMKNAIKEGINSAKR